MHGDDHEPGTGHSSASLAGSSRNRADAPLHHAQALKNGLKPGEICWVVAHCRPGGAGARYGEGRVEREADLDRGSRLVTLIKIRDGGRQPKMRIRMTSVGLDRPSTPRDRLLPAPEVELREACVGHPEVRERIAGAQAQRLDDVSLRFFGATDENLAKADKGMSVDEISIQRQRMLTFGNALRGALGCDTNIFQTHLAKRMVRD